MKRSLVIKLYNRGAQAKQKRWASPFQLPCTGLLILAGPFGGLHDDTKRNGRRNAYTRRIKAIFRRLVECE
jgi:hypothetical protein